MMMMMMMMTMMTMMVMVMVMVMVMIIISFEFEPHTKHWEILPSVKSSWSYGQISSNCIAPIS